MWVPGGRRALPLSYQLGLGELGRWSGLALGRLWVGGERQDKGGGGGALHLGLMKFNRL